MVINQPADGIASSSHILVEEVDDHLRDANVGPPAVNENESPETLELSEGEVSRLSGLHSFIAKYTAPYVSFLYHVDIIRAVANRECDLLKIRFDESHHESLLHRRDSTAHD